MKNKLWRIIPKITYTNYKKRFPNMSKNCFPKLFEITRFWGNRLISISFKHYILFLDFRYNWVADMCRK